MLEGLISAADKEVAVLIAVGRKHVTDGLGTDAGVAIHLESTAYVTVNRSKALNALNLEMITELKSVFETIELDDVVKGVILTGAGDKAFVAGADIAQMKVWLLFLKKEQLYFKITSV